MRKIAKIKDYYFRPFVMCPVMKFLFTVYKRRHNWLEHILTDRMIRFQQNTNEVEQPVRHSTLVVIHCHLYDENAKIRETRTKIKAKRS